MESSHPTSEKSEIGNRNEMEAKPSVQSGYVLDLDVDRGSCYTMETYVRYGVFTKEIPGKF